MFMLFNFLRMPSNRLTRSFRRLVRGYCL